MHLSDVKSVKKENGYEVLFTVRQIGAIFRLSVPVTFRFKNGEKTERLTITRDETPFALAFMVLPTEIVLDERYDVFRRLTMPETPPTIERLLAGEKIIVVSSPSKMDFYAGHKRTFGDKGAVSIFLNQRSDASRKFVRGGQRSACLTPQGKSLEGEPGGEPAVKRRSKGRMASAPTGANDGPGFRRQRLPRDAGRLKDDDLASASLLIIGADNPLLKRLGIEAPAIDDGFGIFVTKNPLNLHKVVAVSSGKSKEEIDLAQRRMTDFRKFSIVAFNKGILVDKTVAKADNGIRKGIDIIEDP